MKKIGLIVLIVVLSTLVVGLGGYFIYDNVIKENDNNSDNDNILSLPYSTSYIYAYSDDSSMIKFYKYDTKLNKYKHLNTYTCESDMCGMYSGQIQHFPYHFDGNRGKALIAESFNYEGSKIILYDAEKGVLGEYKYGIEEGINGYNYIMCYSGSTCSAEEAYYLYLKSLETGKNGIIDLDGNVIKDFVLEDAFIVTSSGMMQGGYSISKNMYVDKINNKVGIIEITSDKVVVGHNYDDIRLLDSDVYFKAKLNDKWDLYSYDNEVQKTIDGYDNLIFVNDNIILAQIDNYLYIKDTEGNNLVDEKMEVFREYIEYPCCQAIHGIEYKLEGNYLTIEIYKDLVDKIVYEYNLNSRQLIKK